MTTVGTESPATIMVIDDHPLLRRGVRQLLEIEEDLSLVFDTGSPREGLEQALAQEPDMLLLDLNMPDIDGLELLKQLRDGGFAGRIIMYTVSDQEDNVVDALRSGADGYLLKDMEPEALVHQLRQATLGRMAISDDLTSLLARALRSQRRRDRSQPGRPYPARARNPSGTRRRHVQQADRPQAGNHRGHGQGPRQAPAEKAPAALPGRSRGLGRAAGTCARSLKCAFPAVTTKEPGGSRQTATGLGIVL